MRDPLLVLGALFGAAGVGLGAFGAHGLKERLGAALATWETAVFYQVVHALAVVAVAILLRTGEAMPGLRGAGWTFVVGTLLFSGSLYLIALGGPRWIGPITPVGGLAFIVGWLLLAAAPLRAGARS